MSITMREVLELPCMREARVVAGQSGLDKSISAVSVLEYAEPTPLQEELLRNIQYSGNEVVITAFAGVKDSAADQCNVIRRLNAGGDVGLLLYYMGLFVEKLDEMVLDTANELGFVLVVMPPNRYDLRYSEAIAEIQNAIFKSQRQLDYFVPEVLEQVSSLPDNQKHVNSLLRIISDRLHLTLIITDNNWHLLYYAAWPSTLERDVLILLDEIMAEDKRGGDRLEKHRKNQVFRGFRLQDAAGHRLNLLVVGEDDRLREEDMGQIVEAARLFLKMRDVRRVGTDIQDFLRAIVRDEPARVRRLARDLNIDAESIHNMLLFKPVNMEMTAGKSIMNVVRQTLAGRCQTVVMDVFDDCVLVLLDDGVCEQWVPVLKEMYGQLTEAGIDCRLMYSCDLKTAADVRKAYILVTGALDVAMRLYPGAKILSASEIKFAGRCQEIIEMGEQEIADQTEILHILDCADKEQERELHKTLAVFYFDAHMKAAEAAELMFLHKNTIKYRLKKISERLGCGVTEMPEMQELYRALALERLLQE